MHEQCGPPKFELRDWANFDFSRWHLDGLDLDATSAALADLSQRLFASEEWQEHFRASLPALTTRAQAVYRDRARELEQEKAAAAAEFDERIAAAQRRSEDFGKMCEASGAPPVLQPDPATFTIGVRVAADDGRVGLPGVVVQMAAARDPKGVLAQAVTDPDGNAVLTVPAARTGEPEAGDATLEILSAPGKSLQKLPDVVRVRGNQAETKIVTLRDSPEIADNKSAALGFRADREVRRRDLVTSIDRLRQERQARLDDLDCRIEDTRKILADIEQPPGTEPTPPVTRPSGPRPTVPGAPTPPRPRPDAAAERPSPRRTGRRRT